MKHTNKEILAKGLKYLAGALPFTFLGPIVIYSAFQNQEHLYYIPVLIAGILVMLAAIFLLFKGISIIMKALFD